MSKSTLRKRIALTATTALFAGVLTVISVPVASATHSVVGGSNDSATEGTINGSLFVAVEDLGGASAVIHTGTAAGTGHAVASSKGLLSKDTSSGTAQTSTALVGARLSFYAQVSTTAAFSVTGGSLADGKVGDGADAGTVTYNGNNTVALYSGATSATAISTIWTAPSTPGTYTVNLYVGDGAGTVPTLTDPAVTLAGSNTVTVVATSAGGTYSAANSQCSLQSTAGATLSNVDAISFVTNGNSAYLNFDLDDAYDQSIGSTVNLVATATNGAYVKIGTQSSAASVGTSSTDVTNGTSQARSVRISQATANAPVTTTVTITANGVTVCTKTVTIRGEISKLVVASVATQSLSSTTGSAAWIADGTGRAGSLKVQALDSAGNVVVPVAAGFAPVASTLTTVVQNVTFPEVDVASSTTATEALSASVGWVTCGAVAGSAKIKIQYTNPTTGKVTTSDEFTQRCAGAPYTYTASWDKAVYTQGSIATLTVKFLDSKGNTANSVQSPGAVTIVAPFLTAISTTGSATMLTDADGVKTYTWTVGTTGGMTAGSYTTIIDFTGLTAVAATKATPSYTLTTGSTDVTNADVLKSIVALIASINKQIQALQKLILKR